jgi:3-oxoadipate enol-lactonase
MGGYILLALARLAPQRMAGVILADTRETPDTPDAKKGRYETIEKVKREGVRVVAESMLPKMLTAHAPKAMAEEVKQIMLSSSPHGVVAALTAMAERPDSSATLRRIDVPALVMAGDADAITPPSDAARMAEALPRATPVTIRGAAHLANYEQPQQFNDAVSSFLRRL